MGELWSVHGCSVEGVTCCGPVAEVDLIVECGRPLSVRVFAGDRQGIYRSLTFIRPHTVERFPIRTSTGVYHHGFVSVRRSDGSRYTSRDLP